MGQVFRNHSEELCKKCVLYPLMFCLKNNRSQLGRCSLSPQIKEINVEVLMLLTKRPLVQQKLKIISQHISGVSVMTAVGLRS